MKKPQAFPQCAYNMKGGYDITGGMTLRDYFAAKAMEKLMGKMHDSILEILKKSYEDDDAKEMSKLMIADTAYEWADAMMNAREA